MSTHLHQLNRHLRLGYVAFPSPRGLFASVPSSMTAKTINTEDPLGSEVSLADLNGPATVQHLSAWEVVYLLQPRG